MISNRCWNVLPRDVEFDFDWTALIICKIYPLNGVLYSDTAMSTHSVRYVKAYLCVCVRARALSDNKNRRRFKCIIAEEVKGTGKKTRSYFVRLHDQVTETCRLTDAEGTVCSPINITSAFNFSLQVCKRGGGNCRHSSTCPVGKLGESVGKWRDVNSILYVPRMKKSSDARSGEGSGQVTGQHLPIHFSDNFRSKKSCQKSKVNKAQALRLAGIECL